MAVKRTDLNLPKPSQNKLEEKRQELIKLANLAPRGSHKRVAQQVGISEKYLYQIRTRRSATLDSIKNKKLFSRIIEAYRVIILKIYETY